MGFAEVFGPKNRFNLNYHDEFVENDVKRSKRTNAATKRRQEEDAMKKIHFSLFSLVIVFLATHLHAEGHSETPTAVPAATLEAVEAYHEVFEPVWHYAYPEKDIAAIAESVPKLEQAAEDLVAAVNANGPEHMKAGVAGVSESVDQLSAVVAGGDHAKILGALEQAHDKMHVIMEQSGASDH
jgi:hypothetical protein